MIRRTNGNHCSATRPEWRGPAGGPGLRRASQPVLRCVLPLAAAPTATARSEAGLSCCCSGRPPSHSANRWPAARCDIRNDECDAVIDVLRSTDR